MTQFNPRSSLRQIPNALLARFLSGYPDFAGFDWSQVSETRIEPVFDCWQQMPEAEKRQVGAVLRQAHSLATSLGTTVLIEATRRAGIDVAGQLRAISNAHERALWCYLECPAAFEDARTLAHIDSLPQRSSDRRTGLPQQKLEVTDEMLRRLERVVAAYYLTRDGRGERCTAEYRHRTGDADSFFVYPSDYADEIIGYSDTGEFARKPWRGIFEIVFTYYGNDGTLDVYAQGGKQVRDDLAAVFARVVLEQEHQPTLFESTPYRLDVFRDRNLTFPTDPADCLAVRLKGLRLALPTVPAGRIAIDVPSPSTGSAFELIEKAIDQQKVPLAKCDILEASLHARFEVPAKRPRNVTFKVSPTTCTLGDSVEEEKLKAYLRKWRIAS